MLRKNLSTEGTDHRNLDGFKTDFFSSCARNLWGKSVLKNGRGPEIIQFYSNL